MPTNPFGKRDSLAAGGGSAWGGAANAGAAGFGSAEGGAVEEYDVVEIVDETQPAAPAPPGRKTRNGGLGTKNSASHEAYLTQREQEVRRREAALAARGAAHFDPMLVKNFPSCCPMVHHDIVNDIPEHNKNVMRAGFLLFLMTCVALTWNFIASILAVILVSFEGNEASVWFFAAIYLVLGIPGAWFTWYGRLYRALMSDGALSWAGFFFMILVHTAFAVFTAVAPSFSTEGLAYAHVGWLPTIELFKGSNGDAAYRFVAICYAVGASVWTLTSVFSIILMGRVYAKMRGGTSTERARQQAYAMGAQAATAEMTRNGAAAKN